MKAKKGLKRIAALLMCIVLLATSLPIALAANGEYNPAPYFTEEAQKEGAAAWIDADGNLQVRFPAATGRPTHAVWKNNHDEKDNVKEIDYYIVEVSDLGAKLTAHETNLIPLLTKKVSSAEAVTIALENSLATVFPEEDVSSLLHMDTNRYNVSITAVDKDGWFSMAMHALVSDVPEYVYDADAYKPLATSETAARELMLFEASGNGTGSGDYEQTGNTLTFLGKAEHAGVEGADGKNSYAYAFRTMSSAVPTAENPQTFVTKWSRQQYSASGAEEVWFWMDLSQVELQGLAFQLRSNQKMFTSRQYSAKGGNKNDDLTDSAQRYSTVTYSTRGTQFNTYPEGEEPYVLLQQTDGSWKKVLLSADGTVDIRHFKGYIRVPMQYMCSTAATYVDTDNTKIGLNNPGLIISGSTFTDRTPTRTNAINYYNDTLLLPGCSADWDPAAHPGEQRGVLVDPAGTPADKAMLLQGYQYRVSQIYLNIQGKDANEVFTVPWPSENSFGNVERDRMTILATGLNSDNWGQKANDKRASIDLSKLETGDPQQYVVNRENGYKVTDDIYGAGFSYTGISEDSKDKSFFLDNVLLYRMDGDVFDDTPVNGAASDVGKPMADYYDQSNEIPKIILNAIDTYITVPDWTDYRAVHYIEDLIQGYRRAFAAAGLNSDFLNYDANNNGAGPLADKANALGKGDTWQKFIDAYVACRDAQTLDTNNSMPDDLVPLLVQELELLPDPSMVTSVSDALVAAVTKLYQAYIRLNYGQLKMFGNYTKTDEVTGQTTSYEEAKLLTYVDLLSDQLQNTFATGTRLANLPYVVFNDFEKNTTTDVRVPQLENDPLYAAEGDYRKTQGIYTFSTRDADNVIKVDRGVDASFTLLRNNSWGMVTDNGFKGSRGAEITINSSLTTSSGNPSTDNSGVWHAVNFARNSSSAADFTAYSANNMREDNLGGLAKTAKTDVPLSLVFYVDFSEMENFAFTANVYTVVGGKRIKARPDFGTNVSDQNYRLLDPETGTWVTVHAGDRYSFLSTGASGDTLKLDHYKGYLAVPLFHLKYGTTQVGGQTLATSKLDEGAEALNNIYNVQFAIASLDGSLDEKSYVIDNIGFTYDPEFYADVAVGRTDATYAECFYAKSTAAEEFENYISSIDPHGSNLINEVQTATNMYNALGQYQKDNVKSVMQAKEMLDLYQSYVDGIARPDTPTLMPNELKEAIAALPERMKTFDATAESLPSPGYIASESPTEFSAINYAALGFTDDDPVAQAETVASYYADSYRNFSKAQREMMTEDEIKALVNAYNAAMRCLGSMETTVKMAGDFSDKLVPLYTGYYDYNIKTNERRSLIKAADREAVVALSVTEYDSLPYYAKTGLSDGSIIKAYAGMTNGLSRYLANTNIFKANGADIPEDIPGGVLRLMNKYTQLYDDTKAKLDSKQTFEPEELQALEAAIAEYNDLIPAYKNIYELYYGSEKEDGAAARGTYKGIKDILDLFITANAAFEDGTAETTLALTEDNITTESKTLNLNYLEEYPVVTGGASSTYFTLKYDGVLASGVTLRHYQLMLNGNEIPSVAYDAEGIQLTEAMLGGSLKNNTYTEANPFAMTFTAKLTDTEPFSAQLSDLVTIVHYRPADTEKGETEPQVLGTYKLHITYTPEEAYTVTIPAEFPIDWGTEETDVSYSVDCVLKEGSSVAVSVAGSNKLTAAKDAAYTMDYTPLNFDSVEFQGVRTAAKPALLPTVAISEEMWTTKPVGEYRDTLTYTVVYTPSENA